jgi:cardiolipin synthase
MLHAKTLVVDDAVAVVGTANSDPRSFFLNFEVVAACYQAGLCHRLARCFEEDLASATEITAAAVERTGLVQRLLQNAARPLSPVL